MNRIARACNIVDDSYDWDSEGWVSDESDVSLADDAFSPVKPTNFPTGNTAQTKPFTCLPNKRESIQGKYLDDTLEEDDSFKISEPFSKYSGPWPTRDRHQQARDFGASCPSLGADFFPDEKGPASFPDASFSEPWPIEVETNNVRRRSIAPRIVRPIPVSSTKKTMLHNQFRDIGESCPSFDFNYSDVEKGKSSPPKHSPLDSEFEYAKCCSIAPRSIAPASVGNTKKMESPKFQRRKNIDVSPHTAPVQYVSSPPPVKLNATVSSEAQNNALHNRDFFSESCISLDMSNGDTNIQSNDPPATSMDIDAAMAPLSTRWTVSLKRPQSAPATIKRRFSFRSRGSEVAPLPPAFAAIESMGQSSTKLTGGHGKSRLFRSPSMIVTKDEAAAAVSVIVHRQQSMDSTPRKIASEVPKSEPAWLLRVRQQNLSRDSRQTSIDKSNHTTETQSVSDESLSLPPAFQSLPCLPSCRKVRVPSVIGDERLPAFAPAFFEPRIQKQEESTAAKLTWTRELEDNFSDWSITIKYPRKGGNKTFTRIDKYYVHRNVVGAGNHASKYFYKVFKKSRSSGSNTDIELSGSAAAAFPVLLDFIYGINGGGVEVCTESAAPLRYLGDYFGVSSLFNKVNKFIQDDINRNNVHLYLKDAQAYDDDDLVQVTLRIAVQFWRGLLMKQGRGDFSPFMDLLNKSQLQEVLELARGSDGSDGFKCETNMRSPLYQWTQ
jgi:hypothetical protein